MVRMGPSLICVRLHRGTAPTKYGALLPPSNCSLSWEQKLNRSEEHSHRWIKFEGGHAVISSRGVHYRQFYFDEIPNEVLRVVPENNGWASNAS